jgi:mannan endo-1,4-beta-mannosidase
MMWEIMNEPRSSGVTPAQMKTFLDASAALIKSLDPHHLVATGSLSQDEPGTTDFALIHSGPNIDAGSLHSYDYEYQNSRTIVSPHFAGAKAALDSVNKPIYVGEEGLSLPGDSKQLRSDVMKAKSDGYLSLGASGVLGWGFSMRPANINDPYSGTSDGPGDPIMTMLSGYTI